MDNAGPTPEQVDKAVRTVVETVRARYDVVTALLYGSRARGDHRPDSDADVAIVINHYDGSLGAFAADFGALTAEALIETGVRVSPMPIRLRNRL